MHENRRERKIGGIFIPAFLFIGIGIGLLFSQPGVGALVGLGVGFLAMAVTRGRESMGTGLHPAAPVFISILVGLVFILAGFGIIYFPAMIWPYLGAAVLILLGIWFMFRGYRALSPEHEDKEPVEKGD